MDANRARFNRSFSFRAASSVELLVAQAGRLLQMPQPSGGCGIGEMDEAAPAEIGADLLWSRHHQHDRTIAAVSQEGGRP